MKWLAGLAAGLVGLALATLAGAADYETLRHLNAAPPTSVAPLPLGTKTKQVEFARIVVHPVDGEAWAISYATAMILDTRGAGAYELMSWDKGAVEGKKESFARVFDQELKKAGFSAVSGESLFDDAGGSADIKVGVLVDDLKGRFCLDCPNIVNPKGIPGTAVLTAQWEIYSALDRKVLARITTRGGADYRTELSNSILPVVLEGFRENVRQLLASDDFRRVVTSSTASPATASSSVSALTPIAFTAPNARVPVAQSSTSVAVIYAADGAGSGFLVSGDGYVLTNQHVVGGSKYVKLKWSNGAETVGEVIRADARRDVALIKTDAQGRPALSLRPGPVQQGEPVFAIGTPLQDRLQNTMTKGIVSAERVEKGLRFIQSDAGVNHGNSGGPLLDDKGAVVAITVSGILPDSMQMGLNFFIPIDDALKALSLTPVAAAPPATPSKPVRPRS
jgi:serine protease Do